MYEKKIFIISFIMCCCSLSFATKTEELYTIPIKDAKCLSGTFWENRGTEEKPRYHYAIDILANEHTLVYAITPGVVIEKGFEYPTSTKDGYGNWIKIKDEEDHIQLYAHLNTVEALIGQKVLAGQVIGAVGHTGLKDNRNAPHLHLAVFDKYGAPVFITKKFGIIWKINN